MRAFTVIFVATIVIWFLQNFDFNLSLVNGSEDSMLAIIAGFIAPVFAPLGFGSWKVATALISGFMAKESVVSTLSVLFGGEAGITAVMAPEAAGALLIFCLLYTPCVAAIASVKRELGGKWAAAMVLMQCTVAWIVSFAAYGIFCLF